MSLVLRHRGCDAQRHGPTCAPVRDDLDGERELRLLRAPRTSVQCGEMSELPAQFITDRRSLATHRLDARVQGAPSRSSSLDGCDNCFRGVPPLRALTTNEESELRAEA